MPEPLEAGQLEAVLEQERDADGGDEGGEARPLAERPVGEALDGARRAAPQTTIDPTKTTTAFPSERVRRSTSERVARGRSRRTRRP